MVHDMEQPATDDPILQTPDGMFACESYNQCTGDDDDEPAEESGPDAELDEDHVEKMSSTRWIHIPNLTLTMSCMMIPSIIQFNLLIIDANNLTRSFFNRRNSTQNRTINQQKYPLDIKKPGNARLLTFYKLSCKTFDRFLPFLLTLQQVQIYHLQQ